MRAYYNNHPIRVVKYGIVVHLIEYLDIFTWLSPDESQTLRLSCHNSVVSRGRYFRVFASDIKWR